MYLYQDLAVPMGIYSTNETTYDAQDQLIVLTSGDVDGVAEVERTEISWTVHSDSMSALEPGSSITVGNLFSSSW